MKRLIFLVCCSLFFLTGCGKASYLETTAKTSETQINPSTNEVEAEATINSGTIFVQVAGSVVDPGVYELPTNSRVYQAIELAGGFSRDADDSDINQAALLSDGEKVYIFSREEKAMQAAAEKKQQDSDGLININTASVQDFMTLPGIGESKATLIVSYRDANGDFSSIEDLMNVSGIGQKMFERISAYIKV